MALVRGSSSAQDVEHIAMLTHITCAFLRCRLWVEWVDSDSSCVDGLSRAGLKDQLICEQSLELAEAEELPWQLFS